MVSPALVNCTVGLVSVECLDDAVLKPDEGLLSGRLKKFRDPQELKRIVWPFARSTVWVI